MTFDEFLTHEEDHRPVIGHCCKCGCDIHDESPGYFSDPYYSFDGVLICRDNFDCLQSYMDEHYLNGGL